MKKNQKGITLIALVITIIVLLILAGVSIAMLRGDQGIVSNASKAKSKSGIAEAQESIGLAINSVNAETETQRVEDSNWDPKSTDHDKALTKIFVNDLGGEKGESKYHTSKLSAATASEDSKDSLGTLVDKILIYSVNGTNYKYTLKYATETGYYSVEFKDTDTDTAEKVTANTVKDTELETVWGSAEAGE